MTDDVRNKMNLVVHKLTELHDAIWHVNWDLKPGATRLLSPEQVEQLEAIREAVYASVTRLAFETKPVGWRKGQRVTVLKGFDACRTPTPSRGTRGKVDRVFQNEYGWWVVVAFTEDVVDEEGTVWTCTPSNPMNVWYKPDEIVKGWQKHTFAAQANAICDVLEGKS